MCSDVPSWKSVTALVSSRPSTPRLMLKAGLVRVGVRAGVRAGIRVRGRVRPHETHASAGISSPSSARRSAVVGALGSRAAKARRSGSSRVSSSSCASDSTCPTTQEQRSEAEPEVRVGVGVGVRVGVRSRGQRQG